MSDEKEEEKKEEVPTEGAPEEKLKEEENPIVTERPASAVAATSNQVAASANAEVKKKTLKGSKK